MKISSDLYKTILELLQRQNNPLARIISDAVSQSRSEQGTVVVLRDYLAQMENEQKDQSSEDDAENLVSLSEKYFIIPKLIIDITKISDTSLILNEGQLSKMPYANKVLRFKTARECEFNLQKLLTSKNGK